MLQISIKYAEPQDERTRLRKKIRGRKSDKTEQKTWSPVLPHNAMLFVNYTLDFSSVYFEVELKH